MMVKDITTLRLRLCLTSVLAVAEERIRHNYLGLCPDGLEGPDVRDPECVACGILTDAVKILKVSNVI